MMELLTTPSASSLSNTTRRRGAVDLFHKAIQIGGPRASLLCASRRSVCPDGRLRSRGGLCRRSRLGEPANVDLRLAYANLLHLQGDQERAAKIMRFSWPNLRCHAEAWFNLGVTRTFQQRPEDAKRAYQNAVGSKPMYPEAWNNLALLERLDGNLVAAEASYRRALLVRPDYRDALYNFAVLLQEQDRLQEATSIYERLLAIDPRFGEAHNNLGNCYLRMNRLSEAQNQYLETLAVNASHKEAPWNLGFASLLMGDFQRGWAGYEHRLVQHEIARRQWRAPRWNGKLARGQRILVHTEQGSATQSSSPAICSSCTKEEWR